jgi:hypothetical protein
MMGSRNAIGSWRPIPGGFYLNAIEVFIVASSKFLLRLPFWKIAQPRAVIFVLPDKVGS